jgi:hypothetical protein
VERPDRGRGFPQPGRVEIIAPTLWRCSIPGRNMPRKTAFKLGAISIVRKLVASGLNRTAPKSATEPRSQR